MSKLIPMDEWLKQSKKKPFWERVKAFSKKVIRGVGAWCKEALTMFVHGSAVAVGCVGIIIVASALLSVAA